MGLQIAYFSGPVKLKQRPEDFRVEEVNRIEPGMDGPFAIYRLQQDHLRRAMDAVGLLLFGLIFFEDDMEIGAAETEGAHAGSPRKLVFVG